MSVSIYQMFLQIVRLIESLVTTFAIVRHTADQKMSEYVLTNFLGRREHATTVWTRKFGPLTLGGCRTSQQSSTLFDMRFNVRSKRFEIGERRHTLVLITN